MAIVAKVAQGRAWMVISRSAVIPAYSFCRYREREHLRITEAQRRNERHGRMFIHYTALDALVGTNRAIAAGSHAVTRWLASVELYDLDNWLSRRGGAGKERAAAALT